MKVDLTDEIQKLEILYAMIRDKLDDAALPRNVTLERACEFSGANYSSVKNERWRQPKGGKPDAFLNGVRVWCPESIIEWAGVTDETRIGYLEKCGFRIDSDLRVTLERLERKARSWQSERWIERREASA